MISSIFAGGGVGFNAAAESAVCASVRKLCQNSALSIQCKLMEEMGAWRGSATIIRSGLRSESMCNIYMLIFRISLVPIPFLILIVAAVRIIVVAVRVGAKN